MKFSNPVEKYYNDNRYQFRNIKSDDNKDVIVKIEPKQITIKQSKYGYAVDFHKLADLQAISNVVRNIENEFNNVKSLLYTVEYTLTKLKQTSMLYILEVYVTVMVCIRYLSIL